MGNSFWGVGAVVLRYADAVFCVLMRATIVIAHVIFSPRCQYISNTSLCCFPCFETAPDRTGPPQQHVLSAPLVGMRVYRQYALILWTTSCMLQFWTTGATAPNFGIVSVDSSWNVIELSWNLMAHGDAREGKWRGNRRVEWIASSLSLYLRTWCIQHYYHYYRWWAHLGCQ